MPNNQNLISTIQLYFANISGNIPLTLAEADYLDTYVRPFNFPKFPYDVNGDFLENIKTLSDDLDYWFDEDKVYAIQCVKENKKMQNKYQHWYDIPLSYLDWYHIGFTYMDNVGFLFYTPAIMVNFLNKNPNDKQTGLAFEWWFQRIKNEYLNNELQNLLKYFNKNQTKILADFLRIYAKDFCDDQMLGEICLKIETTHISLARRLG